MTVSALLYLPMCMCLCVCLRLSVWAFKLKWPGVRIRDHDVRQSFKPACVYVCVHTSLIHISWSLPFVQRLESSARNCEKSGPDDNVTISSRSNSLCVREVHKHFTVTTMCHSLSPFFLPDQRTTKHFFPPLRPVVCVLLFDCLSGWQEKRTRIFCMLVCDWRSLIRETRVIREDENYFFFCGSTSATTALSSPSFSSWTLVRFFSWLLLDFATDKSEAAEKASKCDGKRREREVFCCVGTGLKEVVAGTGMRDEDETTKNTTRWDERTPKISLLVKIFLPIFTLYLNLSILSTSTSFYRFLHWTTRRETIRKAERHRKPHTQSSLKRTVRTHFYTKILPLCVLFSLPVWVYLRVDRERRGHKYMWCTRIGVRTKILHLSPSDEWVKERQMLSFEVM